LVKAGGLNLGWRFRCVGIDEEYVFWREDGVPTFWSLFTLEEVGEIRVISKTMEVKLTDGAVYKFKCHSNVGEVFDALNKAVARQRIRLELDKSMDPDSLFKILQDALDRGLLNLLVAPGAQELKWPAFSFVLQNGFPALIVLSQYWPGNNDTLWNLLRRCNFDLMSAPSQNELL
jgi:hypothetical protein